MLIRCVINADKLQSKRYGTTIIIEPKKENVNVLNVTNTNINVNANSNSNTNINININDNSANIALNNDGNINAAKAKT